MKTHLCGHEWAVLLVQNLRTEDGQPCYGTCHQLSKVIEIESGHSDSVTWETALHEFVHAVSDEFGLGLSEAKVELLGKGLQQMLAPWLPSFPRSTE